MTMSGTLPAWAAVSTTIGSADYDLAKLWGGYAVTYQSFRAALNFTDPTKVEAKFDIAGLEEPVGNARALAENFAHSIDTTTTGLNALDVGSIGTGETWYVWVVGEDSQDTGILRNMGFLASLSDSDPTLPTVGGVEFNYKRLISCFFVDGAGDIKPFRQFDDFWLYSEWQEVASHTSTTSADIDLSDYLPTPARFALMHVVVTDANNNVDVAIKRVGWSNEMYGVYARASHNTMLPFMIPTLSTREFRLESTISAAGTVKVYLGGFYFPSIEP